MFISFVDALRNAGIRASITEHLVLLEALDRQVIGRDPEAFYYLARSIFVHDESQIDRFDAVFGAVFRGALGGAAGEDMAQALPEEWLRAIAERYLSPEEMARVEALGSWDEIMDTLRQRLEEQHGRHQGGSKWIGTGGTSPFGHGGYNPAGVRIGGPGRHGRAVKVSEQRAFRDLDGTRELGTRNIKVALRRLRRFAREGAAIELDMDGTIDGTARRGWLDVRMRPERHNAVKLLLLLDVGGSMDAHVCVAEELFSAARAEFKHLDFWYFHNCPYEGLWKENARRWAERTPTTDVLNKFAPDTRLLFVGDATMSPYEITQSGGSVEHMNPEPGAVWMRRLTATFPRAAWLNPTPEAHWDYAPSIGLMRELMGGRMFPMTLDGLDATVRALGRKG